MNGFLFWPFLYLKKFPSCITNEMKKGFHFKTLLTAHPMKTVMIGWFMIRWLLIGWFKIRARAPKLRTERRKNQNQNKNNNKSFHPIRWGWPGDVTWRDVTANSKQQSKAKWGNSQHTEDFFCRVLFLGNIYCKNCWAIKIR